MLDYARQRAIEVLGIPGKVVLVTHSPAGLQAGEFPCEAVGLDLYLLIPRTSDQLFNLEQNSSITALAANWELHGEAYVIASTTLDQAINLLGESGAGWCKLVRVVPDQIKIRRENGWGFLETIEINPL